MIRLIAISMIAFFASSTLANTLPDDISIVAVVNDDVITSLDLKERMRLVIAMTGREPTPDVMAKVRKKVLRTLVDESLKIQEAERFSIMVGQDDIDGAIGRIERAQKKQPGSMEAFVERKGASADALRQQIKGEVAWTKLLSRKVRRNVKIADDEVFRAQQRLASGKKIEELQIASVILPVTDPTKKQEIFAVAADIRSQLLAGRNANELLKGYKERATIEFGPITWVQREMVHPSIGNALSGLDVGQISNPVETPSGYQIVRLLDKRVRSTAPKGNAEVALKQIVLKLDDSDSNYEVGVMMDVAKSVAKYPGSCMQKGIAGVESFEGLDINVNYIRTTLSNMSPQIRPMVEQLHVTQITEPFAAPDGIHMLMMCERIDMPAPLPDRAEVRQRLFEEKLDLEAEKYLRGLRREAFIDVRL